MLLHRLTQLILLVLLGSVSCGVFDFEEPSSINVAEESSASFGELPDVQLVDSTGAVVSPARLRGSAWALSLLARPIRFQTRAQIDALHDLQTAVSGTDLRIVSLTVDPLRDTAEELARFAQKAEIDSDTWMLWTGPEPEVYRIMQVAFSSSLAGISEENMASFMKEAFERYVVVIDGAGRVRGSYDLFAENGPADILGRLRAVARE